MDIRSIAIALVLSFGLVPAVAQEKPAAPLTPTQAADAALRAVRASDDAALKTLAAKDDPDPWLVADELCRRGEDDAASAFAAAAPRVDVEKLPAWVASRRGKPDDGKRRARLAAADAALAAEEPEKALKAMGAAKDGTIRDVVGVRLEMARARALRMLRRPDLSLVALRSAAEASEQLGWLDQAADAYHIAGHRAQDAADHQAALATWERGITVCERRGDQTGAARMLTDCGRVHRDICDYDRALTTFERAMALQEASGDRVGATDRLADIGGVQAILGNYAKALAIYERSMATSKALGDELGAAQTLANIGIIHYRLGDYDKALTTYGQAVEKMEALGDRSGAAHTLGHIGVVHEQMGESARALAIYERALKTKEELGERHSAAQTLSNIGILLDNIGEHAKAMEMLERALAERLAIGDRVGAAATLGHIGNIRADQGNFEGAMEAFERERRLLSGIPARVQQADLARNLGNLHLLAGRPVEAAAEARRGVEIVSELSRGLAEGEGASVGDDYAELFDIGYRAALRAGQVEDLLWFLEQGRARSLREAMGSRAGLEDAAIPEKLLEALNGARVHQRRALGTYRATVRRGGERKAVLSARKAWEEAQAEVDQVAKRIEREARHAAAVTLSDPKDIEEIRGYLEPGEALVFYGLTSEEAVALVLERSRVRMVALPAAKEIEAAIDALLDGKRQIDPGKAPALRRLIAEPLKLGKDVKRILISPMGRLGYVPFILMFPDREVACVPSGTTYGLLLEDKAARGAKILAMGDPDYGTRVDATALGMRAAKVTRLARLPGTKKEVEAIADVRFLDKQATETGLRKAIGAQKRWRAVHFACHGLIDAGRPMLSALALAADEANDGFLTALEIMRMRVPADLVVMSACETGKGKIYKTEGIVGLTRAFMFAGTPRVICSLWKVDDEATRALMVRFYEVWNPKQGAKGLGAAAALKKAQEFVRGQERWGHPRYWAGWVLWGLGD